MWGIAILIFISRIVDVSLNTIKTLMMVQGRKLPASIIGFFEVGIYVLALGKIVGALNNPVYFIAYCSGFSAGTYLGITLENKLALGLLSGRITIAPEKADMLADILRENRFGVTVIEATGKDGPRKLLSIVFNRKDLRKIEKLIKEYDDRAFMVVNHIHPVSGGYIWHGMKK
ncbi:MAG: DUF2179 domain-containing protein [Tissierellia bacterium]|nr:DUF2179 domain-containing protein [Tissierellia bacterium]